ncbi:molybdopterin biosynthesis protein MoeA [Exophiala viscosa]|uniref:molybdopterin biosynthesis protein MoeA n=1 Tax=Exophiala viscosa TaxID=2486360 RepID=UPI002197B2DC|nr:molybdopterin biosynthesis protein MoeA [Exophiala viscosa]
MSTQSLLRPAILIISDTAAADPSTDKAFPILKETFAQDGAGKWGEPVVEIVKDDILEIQRIVRAWADSEDASSGQINLVVTTGGTGFARRDFTPEAIAPLIHRHAPGIVHGMLAASFQVTPFAMMARPVAGVRNKTIIVTLPGSPKAAKENLQAILKLLPHACLQAAGEDSRAAHVGGVKKLETDAGFTASTNGPVPVSNNHDHSHHHHHHHDHDHGHGGHQVPRAHTQPTERPHSNDPRLGAKARARSSPYPMLSVADAVAKILEVAPQPKPEVRDFGPDLTGYVIAEDIKAAEAVPAYRASIVDGYAVIVPDKKSSEVHIKGTFPVASVSHAQAASLPPPLESGEIARITTGAPLPENANAVIMVEDTTIASLTDDKTEEATIEILTDELTVGENVREPGSDIKLGEMILSKGTHISALGGEIGVLAAAGIQKIPVFRKPRVGIMSTGDEVTDITHSGPLSGGMIRDSNRPSLLSLLRGWRICEEVVDLHVARDTPHNELEEKLRAAFRTNDLDVVITTGGVSMGELDLLKPTIERSLGGEVHFGRVSMKPGKPTTFASVPFKGSSSGERESRLVFGLPGNPASALVTANLFVLPCLQKMAGLPGKGLERIIVRVQGRVKCDKERVEYHRVVVAVDAKDGKLVAKSTGMQRSSRVGSLAAANALLVLPQRAGFLEEGAECEALMMGPILGF